MLLHETSPKEGGLFRVTKPWNSSLGLVGTSLVGDGLESLGALLGRAGEINHLRRRQCRFAAVEINSTYHVVPSTSSKGRPALANMAESESLVIADKVLLHVSANMARQPGSTYVLADEGHTVSNA